jgi:hypothetical protein
MLATTIASGTASSTPTRQPIPCMAGMHDALIRGRFTGPLVCSKANASFVLVGRTTGRQFSIYDYRYRYLPPHGNVMHGGQKIIVFHGKAYVGQYALAPPPFVEMVVKGADVELRTRSSRDAVRLNLSRNPPPKILVNGETSGFFR